MSNGSISLPRLDVPMRILGSIFVIAAYFIVLHVNVYLGVTMNLIGDTMSLPYFIRTKSYDVVGMLGFLMVIGLSKLVSTL
jgi:DMSO/TMAO reductase YedYZ heme-binding membrane subunit